jgi:hypothetical protein
MRRIEGKMLFDSFSIFDKENTTKIFYYLKKYYKLAKMLSEENIELEKQLANAAEENKRLRDGMYSFIIFRDAAQNDYHSMVTLERCLQPDGSSKWKIKQHGNCLGKDGEWELEPMPSSRTDEFYSRCRWDSFDDGQEFWRKFALSGVK